jgi:hypothetical protein
MGISDAGELANSKTNSHSIIGYVVSFENNIIYFKSKTTNCVTTEAAHAELVGYYTTSKIIKSLSNIVVSFQPAIDITLPVTIFGDNLAALWIARTNTNSTRTKHYNLKLHYIYERISEGEQQTKHCNTDDCIADFLTKIQNAPLFLKHRQFFVTEDIEDLKFFNPPKTDKSDISK